MGGALILKAIGKFIAEYWPILAVAALVIAGGLYWNHRTTLIEEQQKQIAQYVVDKATLEEKYKQETGKLLDRIKEQNDAISRFQKQTEQNQATITQAKNEVIRVQKLYNDEIRKILSGTKPEDCQSAIRYLINAAGEFSPKGEPTK